MFILLSPSSPPIHERVGELWEEKRDKKPNQTKKPPLFLGEVCLFVCLGFLGVVLFLFVWFLFF